MENWIKEFRLQVYERTNSPLLGSFIISWCIWNYKFLIILFSDASVTMTFTMIERLAFPSWLAIIGFGVVGPLITALSYIYIYPIPAKFVYEYSLQRQKEVAEMRHRIEEVTPLTQEQSRQIRQNMSAQVEEHYKEIERKDFEISRLKSEIDSLKINEGAGTKIRRVDVSDLPEPSVSESEMKAIGLIADNGGFYQNAMLSQLPNDLRLKLEYDFGELVNKNLVTMSSQQGRSGHKLTHEGKGLLLKLRGNDA